jgi:hypothetical protein
MSLSTQERRALHSIEEGLSGSSPKLVSLLATFTRLTQDEEMPGREHMAIGGQRPGDRRPQAGRHLRPGHAWRARMLNHPRTMQRAGLLLWLVIAICLVAVALAISRNGRPTTCSDPWIAVCATQTPTNPQPKPSGQPAGALPTGQAAGEHMASGPRYGQASR